MKSSLPPLSVDDLFDFDRVGQLSMAPDGVRAVCSVTTSSMEDNRSSTSLWLLSTRGEPARRLTHAGDRDGQPDWSPRGDRIAFVAKREQQGRKDATPQLYVIAADGGEATRVSDFAPGIESFKWMADGRHIVFAAWVWPDLKGSAAQSRQHNAFAARKESGYATNAAFYRYFDHNVPQDRALHLHVLNVATGHVRDLFEGRGVELPRDAGGNADYDPSPDGRRVAFAHDPSDTPMLGNRLVLAEIDVASRHVRTLVDDPAWDLCAPRWRPDGRALAATAQNVGLHHNALCHLALVTPGNGWVVLGADWDHHIDSPLVWSMDGSAVYFCAEERGRRHLWRRDLASGCLGVVREGGWVHSFAVAGDCVVTASDSALHPLRVHALRAEQAARRLETFNDAALAKRRVGAVREVEIVGAQGDKVQMWLTLPVGFDSRQRHAVMQVIHGGPFAAAGDTFGYRWNPHVLAARGHVVAQVNFHGSSGFGFDFRDSILGRQGELELQDIEAGSDWLLAQPWADASRLTATGGSYGGFLVAWMNGHVPAGRYQAYVCHAGVFDRVSTFSADSYPQRPKDLAAKYWQDMPKVMAQSPHSAAAHMNTPTLVIHGAQDFRVPDANGLAYYNTLKARGVAARLLWFPDENHWVLKPRNSKLWYREFLDWIEAYAPATAAPRPSKARKTKATVKAR